MSRQSHSEFQNTQETARLNVIAATKDRLVLLEFKINVKMMELKDLTDERDREQKFLIDIYERGIEAIKGKP